MAMISYGFINNNNPIQKRRCKTMSNNSSNRLVIPAAREAMDKFKMEAASEVGVNLKNGYNGEHARQAPSAARWSRR